MSKDFGEPWKADTENGEILDRSGIAMCDTDAFRLDSHFRRVVACVNFCQHLSTKTLEALTKERVGAATLIQWIRRSHVYHEDFGACAASDSEWGEVCIECNHRIDQTKLHAEDCLLKQTLEILQNENR